MAAKRKRGRQQKIATPAEFQALVDAYLAECAANERPVTQSGALLALGLNSRQSLCDYEGREGFAGPVKRLRLLVEQSYEERLHGPNATGAIFALKNMGWSDKQEIDHRSGDGTMSPRPNVVELVAPDVDDDQSKD